MERQSPERKRAVERLRDKQPRLKARVARRANVSDSMVSKVLHGAAVSADVEAAIIFELQEEVSV